MQTLDARTSAKQVDALTPQLARARSRQQEAEASPFNEAMHLVQQLRQLLDLVNHHGLAVRADFLDVVGMLREAEIRLGRKQVQQVRVLDRVLDQPGLPALARAEQEDRLGLQNAGDVKEAFDIDLFFCFHA